jgi:carbon monoxide dehydrogenase subunit G
MSRVSAKIDIDAPIERVWETVMDPQRLGDWVTIHKSISKVSDSPLRAGSTMDQSMHVRGLTFKVHWTVMSMDAPRHAEWEGGGPAHSTAVIRYELSSTEEGRTTFQYTNEFHVPGGRLGAVASRMIVGATSEREANNSLKRLKALVEHN